MYDGGKCVQERVYLFVDMYGVWVCGCVCVCV